jgi:hypothetical protein
MRAQREVRGRGTACAERREWKGMSGRVMQRAGACECRPLGQLLTCPAHRCGAMARDGRGSGKARRRPCVGGHPSTMRRRPVRPQSCCVRRRRRAAPRSARNPPATSASPSHARPLRMRADPRFRSISTPPSRATQPPHTACRSDHADRAGGSAPRSVCAPALWQRQRFAPTRRRRKRRDQFRPHIIGGVSAQGPPRAPKLHARQWRRERQRRG